MKSKKIIILLLCAVLIIGLVIYAVDKHSSKKRTDVAIPVLLYHNFVTIVPDSDPDNYSYINTPESFEENIKTLLDNGYTTISFKDLNDAYSGKSTLPNKPIIITFDDGYYSNYEYIYPILKKYNVKASIFVVTDKIDKEIDGIKYLTWDNCLEIQNRGLAYPYGAYTKETVKALENNGIDFQVYDIGINNFKDLDKNFIKRINIPCEMTGKEIIEEIEH